MCKLKNKIKFSKSWQINFYISDCNLSNDKSMILVKTPSDQFSSYINIVKLFFNSHPWINFWMTVDRVSEVTTHLKIRRKYDLNGLKLSVYTWSMIGQVWLYWINMLSYFPVTWQHLNQSYLPLMFITEVYP